MTHPCPECGTPTPTTKGPGDRRLRYVSHGVDYGLLCDCDTTMVFGHGATYDPIRATIDHVVPISRGGAHDWDNVVLCCWRCNIRKHARTPEEWAAS